MPEHKRQHYCPPLLSQKPFWLDRQGVAINVFNIARSVRNPKRSVKGAVRKELHLQVKTLFLKNYSRISKVTTVR